MVFALLDSVIDDVLSEVTNPAEEKRSEFHYGRVHGMLLTATLLKERLKGELDAQAARQEQREREF